MPLAVLGMGKLGGGELNFGSDIDLIFFISLMKLGLQKRKKISVCEFFSKVVQRTIHALSSITEDGYVFRVDLRLRPEGSRGPLAYSLPHAKKYYCTYGQTWERAALLRATVVAEIVNLVRCCSMSFDLLSINLWWIRT